MRESGAPCLVDLGGGIVGNANPARNVISMVSPKRYQYASSNALP
jgi:hypothetical protein